MHRGFGALALIALLGACGGDDETPGTASDTPGDGMTAEGDAPAFALMRGADTLLVEQYTLEGNRVSGTLRDPTGSSVEYQLIHATDGGERSMQYTLRPSDPNAGPPITNVFTLRGDSAFLETTRGDSTVRNGDAIDAGALPYLSPSMGMMALLAQSARSIVGDSGQVTLLAASVSQAPVVVAPMIYWRGDTAWVIGNETNQFKLVFSNGELVSAENPPLQMRAVRIPSGGATPAAPAEETAPAARP